MRWFNMLRRKWKAQIKCPKCQNIIHRGKDKGDWHTFMCPFCSCLFTIANSDLEEDVLSKPVPKPKVFNPSMRSGMYIEN